MLYWTAPGDDGSLGTAARYDIRRSTQPLTAANFALGDTVAGVPAPAVAGTAQSCAVALPSPGVTYYFAMRTVDECGNWSVLSNVVSRSSGTAGVDASPLAGARFDPPWPNPAAGVVRLPFALSATGDVRMEIFDAAGRRVRVLRSQRALAGAGEITWDRRDARGVPVARGTYFVRADLGGEFRVRPVTVN